MRHDPQRTSRDQYCAADDHPGTQGAVTYRGGSIADDGPLSPVRQPQRVLSERLDHPCVVACPFRPT